MIVSTTVLFVCVVIEVFEVSLIAVVSVNSMRVILIGQPGAIVGGGGNGVGLTMVYHLGMGAGRMKGNFGTVALMRIFAKGPVPFMIRTTSETEPSAFNCVVSLVTASASGLG